MSSYLAAAIQMEAKMVVNFWPDFLQAGGWCYSSNQKTLTQEKRTKMFFMGLDLRSTNQLSTDATDGGLGLSFSSSDLL